MSREGREQLREAAETARAAGEEARLAAEGARHAAVDSVNATAESLKTTLEQMSVVEEMRRLLRDIRDTKRPDPTSQTDNAASDDRHDRCGDPRQIDCENTSAARKAPYRDPAIVHFSSPATEREPETQPGPVRVTLLE